jgi:hypothetical protein
MTILGHPGNSIDRRTFEDKRLAVIWGESRVSWSNIGVGSCWDKWFVDLIRSEWGYCCHGNSNLQAGVSNMKGNGFNYRLRDH